jgi:predicted solute-binding protein
MMMQHPARYSLAYSPCPNDTYIFAALANGLLADAPPVDVVLDDVEALNLAAREGRYELTKVSSCAPAARWAAAADRWSSRFRASTRSRRS